MSMIQMGHDIMMRTSPSYRMENLKPLLCETISDSMARNSLIYDPPAIKMPSYRVEFPYPETHKKPLW